MKVIRQRYNGKLIGITKEEPFWTLKRLIVLALLSIAIAQLL